MLFGKKLCEEAEAAERYIGNALKRMLKCPPPEDLCRHAWTKMGKTDMNDLPIFKPNFHSCGSGNMNSQQMGYVPGGHCRKETANGLILRGQRGEYHEEGGALTHPHLCAHGCCNWHLLHIYTLPGLTIF